MQVTVCLGAILIPEYLDSILAILLPGGSRIAGIYSGIHSHSGIFPNERALNAFLAYCDMTSFNGGWTMCYTTDDKAKPRTEVSYSSNFPYGSDGYRTNCNNIAVSESLVLFFMWTIGTSHFV